MRGVSRPGRRSIRGFRTAAAAAVLAALLVACPNPVTRLVDTDVVVFNAGGRPAVESRSPQPGATAVAGDSPISVEFSMPIDAASLTNDAIAVSADGTLVVGSVSYNADTLTATFTPAADYPRDSLVEVTVADTVRNEGGALLAEPLSWSFTTKLVNDYEIEVTLEPSDDGVTETEPMYVLAVDVSDPTNGLDDVTDVARFGALSTSTVFYLDLRPRNPDGDFLLAVHHDRDNSVADGTDDLAYDPDVFVPGFIPTGYEDRAHHLTDPDDGLGFHARGGPASTISVMALDQVWSVDRYARNPDGGVSSNPDLIARGGDAVTLRFYDEQEVSSSSPDVTALPVENDVPIVVPVSQYGTHWFRFTPSSGFVPERIRIDRPADGDVEAFVKAWLYEGVPNPEGLNSEGTKFYSPNTAGTGFGFDDSEALLQLDPEDALSAGVEYFLRVVVVHLERFAGGFPQNATAEIRFSD